MVSAQTAMVATSSLQVLHPFNGPTFWKTHGKYSKTGRRGRNYSAVQWKGWVMHFKDGILTPYASGFRMHNGMLRDSKGRLWCGDNQGDFRATSPLYLVEKGNFYGHPSSLVWDKDFPKNKDPLNTPQKELDEMRTHAAVLMPYLEMNRSCAEPAEIPAAFGIFSGQLIIADNNDTRITRIMLDEVGGKLQGSCTHFINGSGLRSGNNRLEWSPDGKQLYVGQTVRGWGTPSEGIQRLSFTGKTPFDVEQIKLTKTGFELSTTLPVANLEEAEISINSFHYQDSFKYGGGQLDKKTIPVTKTTNTGDKDSASTLSPCKPARSTTSTSRTSKPKTAASSTTRTSTTPRIVCTKPAIPNSKFQIPNS